jgi:hypothetical protein
MKIVLCIFQKENITSIILPNKAKHYLISLGLKSKNDSIDAKGLSKWEPNNV